MEFLSLEKVLGGDRREVELLGKELEKNGWVVLKITEDLKGKVHELKAPITKWFQDTSSNQKIQHTEFIGESRELDGAVYGWNSSGDFKEGLRLLTGGRMKQSWLPPQAKDLISNVSNALDQTMLDLMHAIALPIFNTTIDQFGSAPIPFLKNGPKNLSDLNRNNNFGMLDIVYYKSPNPHSQTQLSVAEHYDPGLLSLNVLSDQPGLQFKTREGEWVDIPVDYNLCLLWTGEMCTYITLNRFPPAHHRVIVPSTTPFHPRLSIWIEICTEMQDLSHSMPILEKFSPLSAIASSITSIFSSDPSPPSSSNRNNNMNNNKSNNKNNNKKAPMTKLVLNPGESVASALLRSSRQYGMPATKSITYYCPFCLSRVGRLEPHFKEAHSDIAIEKE